MPPKRPPLPTTGQAQARRNPDAGRAHAVRVAFQAGAGQRVASQAGAAAVLARRARKQEVVATFSPIFCRTLSDVVNLGGKRPWFQSHDGQLWISRAQGNAGAMTILKSVLLLTGLQGRRQCKNRPSGGPWRLTGRTVRLFKLRVATPNYDVGSAPTLAASVSGTAASRGPLSASPLR
jgi:hypothetical protein